MIERTFELGCECARVFPLGGGTCACDCMSFRSTIAVGWMTYRILMAEEAAPKRTAGQEPARPGVRRRTFQRLKAMDSNRAEIDLGLEVWRLPIVSSYTQTPAGLKQRKLSAAPEQGQCEQQGWGIGDNAKRREEL